MAAVTRARVFLGELPRLLRDILTEVVHAQLDMEVIGCGNDVDLDVAIKRGDVDVVILGLNEGSSGGTRAALELLAAHPNLKILAIADDGRLGHVFALHTLDLIEPSPQMLVQAIRSALADAAGDKMATLQ